MISKITLIFEKKIYILFPKKILKYDDKLNKKCLSYIFCLFFKNNKVIKNNNIYSKIIISDDSEDEK